MVSSNCTNNTNGEFENEIMVGVFLIHYLPACMIALMKFVFNQLMKLLASNELLIQMAVWWSQFFSYAPIIWKYGYCSKADIVIKVMGFLTLVAFGAFRVYTFECDSGEFSCWVQRVLLFVYQFLMSYAGGMVTILAFNGYY